MRRSIWPSAVLWAAMLLPWACTEVCSAAGGVFLPRSIDPRATDQIIVKWRASGVAALQIPTLEGRVTHVRAVTGVDVSPVRNLFGQTDVVRLNYLPTRTEMQDILNRLNTDPAVQYAEPDGYRYVAEFPTDGMPNDPFFIAGSDTHGIWEGQWYLLPPSASTPSALSVTNVWQTGNIGSQNVVVAVVDTGIIEAHPDFIYPAGTTGPSKLQCSTNDGTPYCGYDFVSCDQANLTADSGNETTADCSASGSAATYYFANDGHGWAYDAADPGTWIDSTDTGMSLFQNAGCKTVEDSSWHGTKVAGVIGAVTNNGIGVAGVAPLTTILPVRALGKCTGRVSDIAAAILWAAGVGVTVDAGTIAASPAANIINLSLAATTPCSQTEQDAISQAIGKGVLVVAAAGNEGGPLDAPANCSGVVSVVALREVGTKVQYSNLSSSAAAATIAAPGGNCVNADAIGADGTPILTAGYTVPCLYAILTTSDAGATTPSSTPGFYTYEQLNESYQSAVDAGDNYLNTAVAGTSFSAPMVAGVAALMLAAVPTLSPAQIIARLQSSALAFPTSSSTTSTQCQLASPATDSNGDYNDVSQAPECLCTSATCGAGMLNAAAAVQAAESMFVQITPSSTTGSPGERITLDGSASTAATGYHIVSWQWSTIPATSDQLSDSNQSVATLVVPTIRSLDVMLTITDNVGHTASATTKIQSAFASASGAGTLDPLLLVALGACAAWRGYRQRRGRLN